MIAILNLLTCAGFVLHACFGYCPAHAGCTSEGIAVCQHTCGGCHSGCSHHDACEATTESCDCDGSQENHEHAPQFPCDHSGCSIEASVSILRVQDSCFYPPVLQTFAFVACVDNAKPVHQHVECCEYIKTDTESRIARCLWLI